MKFKMPSMKNYSSQDAWLRDVYEKNRTAIDEKIGKGTEAGVRFEEFSNFGSFKTQVENRMSHGMTMKQATVSLANSRTFTSKEELGVENLFRSFMKPQRDEHGRFIKNEFMESFKAQTGFTTFGKERQNLTYVGDNKYRFTKNGISWIIDVDNSPADIIFYMA
ncbi:MAG: hypothetical protein KBS62_03435 [Oscillospiraceae bacterium]|nr:hypothetical protein [Candidatus Ruminococcus equi]